MTKTLTKFLLFWLLSCLLFGAGTALAQEEAQKEEQKEARENAPPSVMATIKPLQLIAAAITDGVSEPALLMRPGASPHHYALRPSERSALEDAGVLLWVGPELENFLVRVVPGLSGRTVTALELPRLRTRSLNGGVDPHVWLDAGNAAAMAGELTRTLSDLDGANAAHYRRNLASFEQALERVDEAASRALAAPDSPGAYAVYHNAFQYFEARHGLNHVTSFVDNEELNPGIRQLLDIRKELQAHDVDCILVEPSVNTDRLDEVIDNSAMRYITVDVLGHGIEVDADGYIDFLRGIADAMTTCLQ